MAHRLQAMGQPNYRNGFEVALQLHALERPLQLTSPQVIFVNSMSDLFHEDIPESFTEDVFEVMRRAHAVGRLPQEEELPAAPRPNLGRDADGGSRRGRLTGKAYRGTRESAL